MIKKPSIIITSQGRTGTQFFAVLFREIIPDGTSLHEPDYINFGQYHGSKERIRQVIRQLRESGVHNLVIKKMLGKWSLLKLSDARFRGDLGYTEAVQQVLRQRKKFVQSQSGSIYIESSTAYRGLIDVLKDVYEQHRVVYIIRDGRDWVQSKMNFGITYNHGKIRGLVQSPWPTALDIENDPYQAKWGTMSRFEKLCWAWVRLNEYALGTVNKNPHARVFRFEDIFKSNSGYEYLKDLVQFVTTFPDTKPIPIDSLDGRLEKRVHKSTTQFPAWEAWSLEHKKQFQTMCNPLMEKLGYLDRN
jgi:hypothetical protein